MVRAPVNPWIVSSFLDSCAFDPKYAPEDEAAGEIHRAHVDQGLAVQIAHSNQKEIEHRNTPAWVKSQAAGLIFTNEVSLTPGEREMFRRIHSILTGTGKPENYVSDARHVFEAQKYGSYFVTTDKRILQRAAELRTICNVEIQLPSQFLKLVRENDNPYDIAT